MSAEEQITQVTPVQQAEQAEQVEQVEVAAPTSSEAQVDEQVDQVVQETEPKIDYVPAPLPVASPWKVVQPSTSPSSPLKNGKKLPSMEDAVNELKTLQLESKDRNNQLLKTFSKEKFVPLNATITVSTKPVKSNTTNEKNNKKNTTASSSSSSSTTGTNGINNKKKRPSNKKKPLDRKDKSQDVTEKTEESNASTSINGKPVSSKKPSSHKQNKKEPHAHSETNSEGQEEKSEEQNSKHTHHPKQNKHSNGPRNSTHPHHNKSKYNNSNRQPRQQQQQNQQPHQNYVYVPFPLQAQDQQPIDVNVPFVSVQSVAKQFQYYFSTENLEKDSYLKNQFSSKNGFIPVSLISKFYRVLNMSYGGDPRIILGALYEVLSDTSLESNVEVATLKQQESNIPDLLSTYVIRSKNWEQHLGEESPEIEYELEKTLTIADLSQFKVVAPAFEPVATAPSAAEVIEPTTTEQTV